MLVPARHQTTVRIVPPQNSTTTFNERRRHVRHKVPSIIYVGLGAGNGGIIINLGAGGLSLQAVAELNPETELTLHFQLEGAKKAIATEGRVTWLGPTQKEAGICFKNLVGNTEQQIAEWIARLEQPAPVTETETEPCPKPSPTNREAPVQPIQNSIQAISTRKKTENTRSNFAREIPRESLSESSQLDDSSIAPDAAPLPAPRFTTLRLRVRPEETFASHLGKSVEPPAEHSDPPLEPATPSIGAGEILPRDAVLPSSSEIISAGDRVRAMPESSTPESRWRRRKIAVSIAASIIGILALIVVVLYLGKLLGPVGSGGQPAAPISPPAAVAPRSAPRSGPAERTRHGVRAMPSPDAPTGADSAPPTHEAVSVPQDGGWVARLKNFLGMNEPTKIDPALVNVPVWTIQHSGFYYCADSPMLKKLRQSAVMMTQGKALQSGYQPKLGSYCQ